MNPSNLIAEKKNIIFQNIIFKNNLSKIECYKKSINKLSELSDDDFLKSSPYLSR
jgi:hypothetical protein